MGFFWVECDIYCQKVLFKIETTLYHTTNKSEIVFRATNDEEKIQGPRGYTVISMER